MPVVGNAWQYGFCCGRRCRRSSGFNDDLAAYVLNEQELELVRHAADPALSFTILWTKKESLLKQTGEGLRNDLKNILVEATCHFQTIIAPDSGYVCTTAQTIV